MDSISEVLVPTDFSSASWQAVLAGIRLAHPNHAHLRLLHYSSLEDEDYNHLIKEKLDKLSNNLAEIYNVDVQGVIEPGELKVSVKDYIAKNAIDVMVLGIDREKYHNGDLSRLIESVNVPVMVVPDNKLGKATENFSDTLK